MHSTKEILGIKTFFAVEQPVKLFWIFIRNRHIANSQIRKLCKEAVLFHIQANCHHINDCVTAFFSQMRENFLRFVRAYKVIRKNMLYILYAFLNDRFIIRTTLLAKFWQSLFFISSRVLSPSVNCPTFPPFYST